MATDYGARFSKAVGCTRHAMGGAAEGMGIEALAGDTEMVTIFDDFNGIVLKEGFGDGANWETARWVLKDDPVGAPTGDEISMNDDDTGASELDFNSCIRIFPGTVNDRGGNMQLDVANGAVAAATTLYDFHHMWIPTSATVGGNYGSLAAAAALDNSTWVFACRIGFRADLTVTAGTNGIGDWNGKVYIGWAEAGDGSIMDHDTGVITQAEDGPLVGFHIGEDGSIDGISQRTVNTAYAEGTNLTELVAAGGVDGTVANGATTAGDTMWFDLALRMDIVDQNAAANNGTTRFYWRKVLPGSQLGEWNPHPTVLTNQTPNNNVILVPTIEVMSGPTADLDCVVFLDWWAFGRNRQNR